MCRPSPKGRRSRRLPGSGRTRPAHRHQEIHVDDKVVAEGPMRVMAAVFSLCGEGLCIGYDGGDAVSREYSPEFEFTGGEIVQLVFDVADETHLDAETPLAALMARD